MSKPQVNVVCMKWGTLYGPEYVNKLQSMVARHLSYPHRFVCLTDDTNGINDNVECFDLPQIKVPAKYDVSPWRKLGMFSKNLADLEGKVLFLDLDVVIVDSIDAFFDVANKFTIIENWTQMGRGIGNSSVYCFEVGAHSDVLEYYNDHMDEVLTKYANEQIYLSKKIGDIAFWPDHFCQSYKRHCIPKSINKFLITPTYKPGTKIVVFHGRPNPSEAVKGGFYGKWYKYAKAAPWVGEHWQ